MVESDTRALWSEKYTPTSAADLCINKQKLDQVRDHIMQMIAGKSSDRILILTGPSGSGKSSTAKALAEEVLCERLGSANLDGNSVFFDDIDNAPDTDSRYPHVIEYTNRTTSTSKLTSSVSYFSEFLEQCKLLTLGNEKCIVVEELPNLYHQETLLSFRLAILKWIELDSKVRLPPLILCVTEFDSDDDHYRGSFTLEATFKLETVFGRKLLQYEDRGWHRIKFNQVARRFLKQALRRVVSGESENFRSIPKGVVAKELEELSQTGDIRNSIITLEYWCRFLYPVTGKESSTSILGKENGLNIFHSIGKIIYGTQHPKEELENFMKTVNITNRYNFQSVPTLDDMNSISVANVAQDLASNSEKLNLNILENYLVLNPPINDDLSKLVDLLSQADTMSSFKTDRRALILMTYYSCFGSRVLCSKLKKTSGGYHRSRYSRDSKVNFKRQKIIRMVTAFRSSRSERLARINLYSHLSEMDAILVDGFYQYQLLDSRKARQKLGNRTPGGRVRRLGGDFKNIVLADNEFTPDVGEDTDDPEYLKRLEARYFGLDEDGDEDQEADDYKEFDDDPIVDSEEEREDEEDPFSDDSLVLQL
ncbi:DEKNAAC102616 [Brettanomyces naardenensis]|uniref:DEKNAAC102616 n=1 Tax=Brettanomyces naardenensis TaxID=13370 RepID=A0A448YKU5_BRENA|nr:DEKNAAC102616 [Brettanomyces naardenensis]